MLCGGRPVPAISELGFSELGFKQGSEARSAMIGMNEMANRARELWARLIWMARFNNRPMRQGRAKVDNAVSKPEADGEGRYRGRPWFAGSKTALADRNGTPAS